MASSGELGRLQALMSGRWKGHYSAYSDDSQKDQVSTFTLLAHIRSDKTFVAGTGQDKAGAFTIGGNVDYSGELTFLKSYNKTRTHWVYKGQVHSERGTMNGEWANGSGLKPEGSFTFTRDNITSSSGNNFNNSLNQRHNSTNLCEVCRSIPFEHLPKSPGGGIILGSSLTRQDGLFIRSFACQHHQGLEALQQALLNCSLCSQIHEAVIHYEQKLKDYPKSRAEDYAYLQIKDYRLYVTGYDFDQEGIRIWSDSPVDKAVILVGLVGFCVEDDNNPLSCQFKGRIVHEDSSSEITFDRISKWVTRCNNDHKTCKPNLVQLPTRVIDVGDQSPSGGIRLWESGGAYGTYVALSHCWGTSTPCTTTRETLDRRRKGIPFDTMTKTFQDAVVITRALGIQYLWIDSLCILQGDKDDWEIECSKMAEVYSNSYLTVAAAGANDGSVGCFVARPTRKYSSFDYTFSNGLTGQVYAFMLPLERFRIEVEFRDQPLTSRGWVVQERILSPRTLFYCLDQIYFECKEGVEGEDGFYARSSLFFIHPEYPPEEVRFRWWWLIKYLGGCRLTRSSDKLPSLAGIARRFEEILRDRYIAGLWESTLMQDLLWMAPPSTNLGSWPPKYRAPSWSWTCIDDTQPPLHYLYGGETFAAILNHHVEVQGENPWGEVSNGWIKIRAPLIQVFLNKDSPTGWTKGNFNFITADQRSLESSSLLDYDIDIDRLKQLTFFAVVFGWIPSGESSWYLTLLVTPSQNRKDCYCRLGYVVITNRDSLGGDNLLLRDSYALVTLV